MATKRILATVICGLTATSFVFGAAAPVSANQLPPGKTKWVAAGNRDVAWTLKRSGDWVKLSFSDVVYRGTVSGNTLRLRPNEGYGGITHATYRYNGRVLKLQWEGRSKWTRFTQR